jgi:hypothetical protein
VLMDHEIKRKDILDVANDTQWLGTVARE